MATDRRSPDASALPRSDARRRPLALAGCLAPSAHATAPPSPARSCSRLLALAAAFGPLVAPHPYDRVYPQYVRTPASLEAYPKADAIIPDFESALEPRSRRPPAR